MFWIYYKSDIGSIGPVGSQLNFPGHHLLGSVLLPLTCHLAYRNNQLAVQWLGTWSLVQGCVL